MTDVLVDTSAWIDFFRRGQGAISDKVEELIRLDQAVLTGPILAELLQGTKSGREEKRLNALLAVLRFLEVERADWEETGEILRSLRSRGVTVPLTDALIAAVAQHHNLLILTLDQHFQYLPVTCLQV